jgi:dTDP-4-amino-4,6-dideoxygalactose transaminase
MSYPYLNIDDLKKHLQKHAIGFRQRYRDPLYRQPVLKKMGFDYSNFHLENAEAVAGNIIGLPNHPGLTKNQLNRVIEVLRAF